MVRIEPAGLRDAPAYVRKILMAQGRTALTAMNPNRGAGVQIGQGQVDRGWSAEYGGGPLKSSLTLG